MAILLGMCLLHLNPICVPQTHLCEKISPSVTISSLELACSPLAIPATEGSSEPPGEFYDETGRYIGNDGKNDNRLYVLKTTDKEFDSEGLVRSAGISNKEARDARKFVHDSSGRTDAFRQKKDIYDYFQEIVPSEDARMAMIRIISRDNGRGGTDPLNNKEYGGIITIFGEVRQVPDGPISDPADSSRHPEIWVPAGPDIQVAFHSHPSGTKADFKDERISVTTPERIGGPAMRDHRYRQAPSSMDVEMATGMTGYVFGMEDRIVYIYTDFGITATFPIRKFKKIIDARHGPWKELRGVVTLH